VDQKAWLKQELLNSKAQWKFVLSEVQMGRYALSNSMGANLPQKLFKHPQPLATDTSLYVDLDAWDGYPAERTELLDYISANNIKNVVVCTGDIHNCYASELRSDMSSTAQPSVAVEIVGGSVTSAGLYEITGGIDLTGLGKLLILGANPCMVYEDLRYHVFTKMIVTPSKVKASYQAVDDVTQPTSTNFVLKEFTIRDGSAKLS
jgi:alkaline phosphatase D